MAGRARGLAARAASGRAGRGVQVAQAVLRTGDRTSSSSSRSRSCARCCSSRARCFRIPTARSRSRARTPAPRCAWSSAPSQTSRPRRGPSPRSCGTPSTSSRPVCPPPSALPRTRGPTRRSSTCCSTRTPPCATRGSASPPAAGAAGCSTSTAPSSPRPASCHRARHAPRLGRLRDARLEVITITSVGGGSPGSTGTVRAQLTSASAAERGRVRRLECHARERALDPLSLSRRDCRRRGRVSVLL